VLKEVVIEESMRPCTINEMTETIDKTKSSIHSLQPPLELPDIRNDQARKDK
jgi:hypothetical protein